MTTNLGYFEQRGTLTFMSHDYTYKTIEGWFCIQSGLIVMRKIRGRNHFGLCSETKFYDFKPHTGKEKK